MSAKQIRESLKGMTDEEKKERKRIKHREYMANRRKQDPEFAQKQRELARKNMTEKRKDEEFNTKHREYCSEYNKKKKEQIKTLSPLFQRYFKACEEYPECKVSLVDGEIWIKTKEGFYTSEHKGTTSFIKRLNQAILESGEGSQVDFNFQNDEIEIVSKDGFSLFF